LKRNWDCAVLLVEFGSNPNAKTKNKKVIYDFGGMTPEVKQRIGGKKSVVFNNLT